MLWHFFFNNSSLKGTVICKIWIIDNNSFDHAGIPLILFPPGLYIIWNINHYKIHMYKSRYTNMYQSNKKFKWNIFTLNPPSLIALSKSSNSKLRPRHFLRKVWMLTFVFVPSCLCNTRIKPENSNGFFHYVFP